MTLTLDIRKKPERRPINVETSANNATHSCLIPALEDCEMGASANRLDVKCFLSVTVELMVVLGVATVLRTVEGRTRACVAAVDAFCASRFLGVILIGRMKQ